MKRVSRSSLVTCAMRMVLTTLPGNLKYFCFCKLSTSVQRTGKNNRQSIVPSLNWEQLSICLEKAVSPFVGSISEV